MEGMSVDGKKECDRDGTWHMCGECITSRTLQYTRWGKQWKRNRTDINPKQD